MSGSSDDLTRAYLDRYCIEWRFLNTREATTECTLFGARLDTPILLGGMARAALEEFAKHTGLLFFVKGIVSVRDAVMCAEAGVAGIVLSHHKDMFPWTMPPLKVLPEIRKAVGSRLTILVDSGLTSGYDVFKALAWGVDGVFTVRPMIPLFQEKGPEAVAERLCTMTDELRVCLSRTGAVDIKHIDPSVIRGL